MASDLLLQRGRKLAVHGEPQFNGAFSSLNVRADPEEAKPRRSLVAMRGIKCKPIAAGPDNMAQMPVDIGKTADRAGIAPRGMTAVYGSRSDGWFDNGRNGMFGKISHIWESLDHPGSTVNRQGAQVLVYPRLINSKFE
ncbi:MAG: hypothetical protein ABSB15_20130 [Bryobacteraceae bacterium]|jgi:hypothetical protein